MIMKRKEKKRKEKKKEFHPWAKKEKGAHLLTTPEAWGWSCTTNGKWVLQYSPPPRNLALHLALPTEVILGLGVTDTRAAKAARKL